MQLTMQTYNTKDSYVKWNSLINEMELEELRTSGSANITFTSTSPTPTPSPTITALMSSCRFPVMDFTTTPQVSNL